MTATVRAATTADTAWMAELSRSSFAPRLHDYLITAQPGVARFWDVLLSHPSSFPARSFLVAEDGAGARLGFADLTLVDPETSHLSYICVTAEARGRGVATELLRGHLDRHPDVQAMRLDVFDDNAPARALYDRLGFEEESRTSWWVAGLDGVSPTAADAVQFDDLHSAVARWEAYGFCELAGTTAGGAFRVGRIGSSVLRAFDATQLTAPGLVAGLATAFPQLERVLAMTAGDEPPESEVGDLNRVNRSLRMATSEIRTRLECQ